MGFPVLRPATRRRASAGLSALLLAASFAGAGCDLFDAPETSDGPVTGTITNASGNRVPGATVQLGTYTATTDVDGRYRMENVLAADYTLTVSAPGYLTYTESGVEAYRDRVIDREIRGPNQVNGQVVNSQNGQPVAGASVAFYRGSGSAGTPVELRATTGADGFFSLPDAPDGTFEMCIFATGFADYCQTGVTITGGTFSIDPVAIAEVPPAGALRIVLAWGAAPSDLDAHLTGPDGAGGRFHVYYASASAGGATLDRDDTSAYGPETVTIATPRDGMYRFSVHNFSDQSATGAQGIAASPTRVQVYDETGQVRSYTAPAATSGNTWRVFEMTVSGSSRTFSDNGGASLGYVQASGAGDAGTFLTGGEAPPPAKGATR